MKDKLREVACDTCGLIIMRHYRFGICDSCANKKSKENKAEIRKRWLKGGQIGGIRTCLCGHCDKNFTVKRPNQRYHPDCLEEVKKRHWKNNQQKRKENEKENSDRELAYVMEGEKPVVLGALHRKMEPEQFAKAVNRLLEG